MAIFMCMKCGNILMSSGVHTYVCEYCGTEQRVPKEKDIAPGEFPVGVELHKKSQPAVGPKKPQPVVEPKKPQPAVGPKKPQPVVEPKKPQPVVEPKKPQPIAERQVDNKVKQLLIRGFMSLEDSLWEKADNFFEDVLRQDALCGEAYLGKLMTEKQVCKRTDLASLSTPFEDSVNYKRVMRYGNAALQQEVKGYVECVKDRVYKQACSKMKAATNEDGYKAAAVRFGRIRGWRDADARYEKCVMLAGKCRAGEVKRLRKVRERLKKVEGVLTSQDGLLIGLQANGSVITTDKKLDVLGFYNVVSVNYRRGLIVGVGVDGRVYVNHGEWYNEKLYSQVKKWSNTVSVCCHVDSDDRPEIWGLRKDGYVVYAQEGYAQNKSDANTIVLYKPKCFCDLVAFTGGYGLRRDGTVVSGYSDYHLNKWKDVVAIVGSYNRTPVFGLCKDGTVVTTSDDYKDKISSWRNIVEIYLSTDSSWDRHVIGLRGDGTVVSAHRYGHKDYGQYKVDDWRDIVSIALSDDHTVGLRSDGTVVAVGNNSFDQCEVGDWQDIVAITCDSRNTYGLRSDGTVAHVGENTLTHPEVQKWKLKSLTTMEQEEADKIKRLKERKAQLEIEIPNVNGWFAELKRKKLQNELAAIECELKKLK